MYKLITNLQDFESCISNLANHKYIGLDTETTSLRPRDGRLRLIQLSDGENIYLIDLFAFDDVRQLDKLKVIFQNPSIIKIIANAKFEHQWIYAKLGMRLQGIFDTYLAEKLIDFDPKTASLAQVASRYLKIDLDKTEQRSDWSGVLSESQLKYAADDVRYLHAIRECQLKHLINTSQIEPAKLEFNAVAAIAEMELVGFPVNVDRYMCLADKLEADTLAKKVALEEFLLTNGGKSELPKKFYQDDLFSDTSISIASSTDVNVNSTQQILKAYRALGVPLETTDQKFIGSMVHQYPQLSYLLNYRNASKLSSTYGRNMLDYIKDGRIYCDFFQYGAVTGRNSSRNPNLQNQPRTKDFRSCYEAPDGRMLVQADYSQIELRILGEFSKDPVIIDAYNTGKDIHSMTAANVYGVPYDDVKKLYADKRQDAKTTNFSVVYGISPTALTLRLLNNGVMTANDENSKLLIDGFYNTYKVAGRWLFQQEKNVMKDPCLRTMAGHLIKLHFDKDDPKQVSKAKRDARNYIIQGTSANITKLGLTKIHRKLVENKWDKDAFIVNAVHDEILVECADDDRKEEIKHLVQTCMEDAGRQYLKRIKVEAEAKIVKDWGDK